MVYNVYVLSVKNKVQKLRKLGKTYTEINSLLNIKIPKSTLSSWCRDILLPANYDSKIRRLNKDSLAKARNIAWKVNKTKRDKILADIKRENIVIAQSIYDDSVAKIALAMLCLGEASKYKTKHKAFSLGSSDPRIIILFLKLLKKMKDFKKEKIRCTVQCRADQNISLLEKYWRRTTKIPKSLFYPTRIDPRTMGKPTKRKDYHGVLVIDYFDRRAQLRIESLADIVYNNVLKMGP